MILYYILTGIPIPYDKYIIPHPYEPKKKMTIRYLEEMGIIFILKRIQLDKVIIFLPHIILHQLLLNNVEVFDPAVLTAPGTPFNWENLERLDAQLECCFRNLLYIQGMQKVTFRHFFRDGAYASDNLSDQQV